MIIGPLLRHKTVIIEAFLLNSPTPDNAPDDSGTLEKACDRSVRTFEKMEPVEIALKPKMSDILVQNDVGLIAGRDDMMGT